MARFNNIFCMFAAMCLTATAAPAENTKLKIPAACSGQKFCSVRPEGYDLLEEKINSALPEFLVKDYADRNGEDTSSEGMGLSPEKDWHNCPYETKRQSMFLYNHGGNDTKIDVFVQSKLFKQYVDVVTCATEHIDTDSNEQCFQSLGVSTFGMKSKCVSSTAKRTLYVFDMETGKVIQKSYDVPACCTCKLSYI